MLMNQLGQLRSQLHLIILGMGAKVKNSLTKTKFETLTFGYFFPRLLLAFQHIDFS
jgi:hypothetical protein